MTKQDGAQNTNYKFCSSFKVVIDGWKLARNINQRKKLEVLQHLHSVRNVADHGIP